MFAIVAVTSFCLLLFYFRNFLRIQWYVDKLPGTPKWPIVGTAYSHIGLTQDDMFEYIWERNKDFRSIFRSWYGLTPIVHLLKPEYCEKVLSSSRHITKGSTYRAFKPWLGEGLVTIESMSRWHRNRKLLTRAFHYNILENFLEVFNEKGCELAGHLSHLADGNEQNMYDLITRCTLDIICKTSLGIESGAMTITSEFVSALYKITWFTMERIMKPWTLYDFYYRRTKVGQEYYATVEILNRVADKVLQERKRAFKKSQADGDDETGLDGRKHLAFLDLLLEYSQGENELTDREIRDEINTIVSAGFDTSSSAISWTLLLLGNHQEVQDKVRQEIGDILQDSSRVRSQHIRDLKYLERVIKESQRLFPSVPVISRVLQHDVQLGKYLIPAGVTVTLHMNEMHRDPENFPEPETFDPDRFLPERSRGRHPYCYVPFSAGPRNCIGQKFAMMEVKVILVHILRNYRVVALERPQDLKTWIQVISKPQSGVRVLLEKVSL